jgi:death-on-curing protein
VTEGEPAWLTAEQATELHERCAVRFGATPGVRDRTLLESALSRPRFRHHYEGASLVQCAAAYAFGVVRNHPFHDGNKRTGWGAMVAFLALNGLVIGAPDAEAAERIIALAEGTLDEPGLARWLEGAARPM